jgi:hypothetical protein
LDFQHFGQPPLVLGDLVAQAAAWGATLESRIVDTLPTERDALHRGAGRALPSESNDEIGAAPAGCRAIGYL